MDHQQSEFKGEFMMRSKDGGFLRHRYPWQWQGVI
jgi:hypothetical protein